LKLLAIFALLASSLYADAQAEAALRAQEQIVHSTDQAKFATYTMLITTAFGFLTLVVTQGFKIYSDNQQHKWEMAATDAHRKLELEKIGETLTGVSATKRSIETLEVNTNSIKDDLVKTTGEKEYARGVKAGEEGDANKRRSVLVVDDQPEAHFLVQEALNECGMAMTGVYDGPTALANVATGSYNLVILDANLGHTDADGLDVLRTLKRLHPALPVVMLSASNENELAYFKAGAADYFVKPLDTRAFALRLLKLFARFDAAIEPAA